LQGQGAKQFFFKYCSTFDSTDQGNIGPVAEALMIALDTDFTIACPAFPENGRSIYQGHLFVGDRLLSESSMKDHPLTPMTDADLVRVLDRQTSAPVGLIPWSVVRLGSDAIKREIGKLKDAGVRHAIVDAITDDDLLEIGEGCAELALLTGGSGVAMGLPRNFRHAGLLQAAGDPPQFAAQGHSAVLAGSCSQATQRQVEVAQAQWPAYFLDALILANNDKLVDEVLAWAAPKMADGPVLIYSTAPSERVAEVQSVLGRQAAGELVETAMGEIAAGLVALGVGQLIVAGGETSGAVVRRLGIQALEIGGEIDPGVPWCLTSGEVSIRLALKSGNFGGEDFFQKALGLLS
jgi:uncharacterized protein YgbK (DUF1537 family)